MNRYMPKPYRCNLCFRSFDTIAQAEAHWFDLHAHTTLATEVRHARAASAIEARSDATPKSDAAEGESAGPQDDAQ